MSEVWLRYNMQTSALPGALSVPDVIRVGMEQAAWADSLGFSRLYFGEHHGSKDSFCPSPLAHAAAFAARTSNMRINCLVLLPYHDPVRVAEDTLVLDSISDGRAELTVGVGYVQTEMDMFGITLADRGRLMDDKLSVLRRALQGEKFEHGDRSIYCTPPSVQKPNPPIYVGGTVKASARRAARLGDGFSPIGMTPELLAAYVEACRELGDEPGPTLDGNCKIGTFITDDPDKAWAEIGPYFLYHQNSYVDWTTGAGEMTAQQSQPGAADLYKDFISRKMTSIDDLRASGTYGIFTPDEALAYSLDQFRHGRLVQIEPLGCGVPADLAWSSLELYASQVLPRLLEQTGGESVPQ